VADNGYPVRQMTVEIDSARFGKNPLWRNIDFSDATTRLRHGCFASEHTVLMMRELG
jgi:hypothetical protein